MDIYWFDYLSYLPYGRLNNQTERLCEKFSVKTQSIIKFRINESSGRTVPFLYLSKAVVGLVIGL